MPHRNTLINTVHNNSHEYTEEIAIGQFSSQVNNFLAYFWCKSIHEEDAESILDLIVDFSARNYLLTTKSWHIAFNSNELWYRAHGVKSDIAESTKEALYIAWLNRLKKYKIEHSFDDYSWYDGSVYFDGSSGEKVGDNPNSNGNSMENTNGSITKSIKKNDLTLKYNWYKMEMSKK